MWQSVYVEFDGIISREALPAKTGGCGGSGRCAKAGAPWSGPSGGRHAARVQRGEIWGLWDVQGRAKPQPVAPTPGALTAVYAACCLV